jgi:hypothetical protein
MSRYPRKILRPIEYLITRDSKFKTKGQAARKWISTLLRQKETKDTFRVADEKSFLLRKIAAEPAESSC